MTTRSKLLKRDGINQLAEGADGYFLYNIYDKYIGASIANYGEYSGLETQFLDQLCRAGDVVVEVGANIGAHTVGIARKVGCSGRVLAFEPQRVVFQTLCANIALNSLTNVECYWAAVSSTSGNINVPEVDFNNPQNFGGVSLLGGYPGENVSCIMLDELRSIQRLRLLKIDVEGMETDVIKGAMGLIGKYKPFIYVENDRVAKSEALMRLIDSTGYRIYWHCPPFFNPDNPYKEHRNIFGNIHSFNLFCVHRSEKILVEGLSEVVDFTIHPLHKK